MIYVDTSVMFAQLVGERRVPRPSLWLDALLSSRLLEYELWNRVHAYGLATRYARLIPPLLEQIEFIDLTADVLARALEPFPLPVRTLDALHLATIDYVRGQAQDIALASFDRRLNEAGRALGIALHDP